MPTEESLRDWLEGARRSAESPEDRPGETPWRPPAPPAQPGRADRDAPSPLPADLLASEEPHSGRSRVLMGLAVIPWVLLVALVITGLDNTASPPTAGDAAERDDAVGADSPTATPEADSGAQPPGAPAVGPAVVGQYPSAHAVGIEDQAVAAAAAVAIRNLAYDGRDDGAIRYVDLAVAEGVSWRGPGVTVVRVLAVILEGSGEAWSGSRIARFAVAMRPGREPVPLGRPWPLPVQSAEPTAADEEWRAVDDPADAEAVYQAVTAAAYRDVMVTAVFRNAHSQGVLRGRVHARAPGEDDAASHDVWVLVGPPPHVLGADM